MSTDRPSAPSGRGERRAGASCCPAPPREVHVAGIVVHALPERIDEVRGAIEAGPGARVEAASADGKLVVTLEAPDAGALADALVRWHVLPGVLAASLVYQHCETEDAMNDEVDLEDHA